VQIVYVMVAIVVPLFNVHFSPDYWVLAVMPMSLFIGNVYWTITNETVAGIIHFITLGYVIVMQYFS